ncbi:MAG TPA: outer membrane lipoprotein-sorting protein [Chitinophagaceae bacterium]|nr:outer membrane lipoprotein-sorting protein [Chitinophagaceae bacterium]
MQYRLLFHVACFISTCIHAQTAKEIVQKANDKMRGTTSQVELTITTVRPNWTRSMDVRAWLKGSDFSLILIQAPARDKGIAFLKRKKEVWNWIPSLERTIKLPPSMMNQSWMGTDFTNDDLVKESSIVTDYNHSIVGDTIIDNRPCYIIEMIPKPEAAIIWGKLIVCIDKKDFLELHTKFFDEDGKLVNVMNAYDVKTMDNRLIPTRFEMIPLEKKNQRTEMIYRSIKYNRPIDDVFFTTEKLKTVG